MYILNFSYEEDRATVLHYLCECCGECEFSNIYTFHLTFQNKQNYLRIRLEEFFVHVIYAFVDCIYNYNWL